MKITVLSENTKQNDILTAEHGLSILIETENYKILFDMGQTEAFASNADLLGVDLSDVDFAVLSHGHYDHGGGISKFLEINDNAIIYLNKNVFGNYYNGLNKYIGLDKALKDNSRLFYTDDEYKIADGFMLYSCNQFERKHLTDPYGLGIEHRGEIVPDEFLHEQYLMIEEDGKSYLFSGCSHKGVINIAEWFKPDVFIGGFHLSKLNDEKILSKTAEILLQNNTMYYTAHCTGIEQFRFMKKIMGDNLDYLSTGMIMTV